MKIAFGKGPEKYWNGFSVFYAPVWTPEAHGIGQKPGAVGLSYPGSRKERADLMQAFEFINDLAEIWGHNGALFQIRGQNITRERENDCATAND